VLAALFQIMEVNGDYSNSKVTTTEKHQKSFRKSCLYDLVLVHMIHFSSTEVIK